LFATGLDRVAFFVVAFFVVLLGGALSLLAALVVAAFLPAVFLAAGCLTAVFAAVCFAGVFRATAFFAVAFFAAVFLADAVGVVTAWRARVGADFADFADFADALVAFALFAVLFAAVVAGALPAFLGGCSLTAPALVAPDVAASVVLRGDVAFATAPTARRSRPVTLLPVSAMATAPSRSQDHGLQRIGSGR
jgi:hypothetical protein